MDAIIDNYTQVNIKLSENEAKILYRLGKLDGKIYRTTGETLPLFLRVSKKGWRAEGVPINEPYENKKVYEIDIPPDGPKKLLKGKIIGTDIITVSLRKVYISLEDIL